MATSPLGYSGSGTLCTPYAGGQLCAGWLGIWGENGNENSGAYGFTVLDTVAFGDAEGQIWAPLTANYQSKAPPGSTSIITVTPVETMLDMNLSAGAAGATCAPTEVTLGWQDFNTSAAADQIQNPTTCFSSLAIQADFAKLPRQNVLGPLGELHTTYNQLRNLANTLTQATAVLQDLGSFGSEILKEQDLVNGLPAQGAQPDAILTLSCDAFDRLLLGPSLGASFVGLGVPTCTQTPFSPFSAQIPGASNAAVTLTPQITARAFSLGGTVHVLWGVATVHIQECWPISRCGSSRTTTSAPATTTTTGPSSASWSIVPSQNPEGPQFAELSDVSCPVASACIAVGATNPSDLGHTLVGRWDGAHYSTVPSPNPNSGPYASVALTAVSCTAPSNCFAVGHIAPNGPTGGNWTALIEHWDGTSWTIVASPNASASRALAGVSCTSTTNCFAVGSRSIGTLIEHWNGTSWSIVPSPNPPGNGPVLNAVSCVNTTTCVAVGSYFPSAYDKTLIEDWNGTSWSIVPSPNVAGALQIELSGVSCASASSCFAVGNYLPPGGASSLTLIEHWDGASWSIVVGPKPSVPGALAGVSCASTSNCFAVGSRSNSPLVLGTTLIERWNGTDWSVIPTPDEPGATADGLEGVSCTSDASCLAIGEYKTPASVDSGYSLVESFG